MKLKELLELERQLEDYVNDLYYGDRGITDPITREEKQRMVDIKELCKEVVKLS